jgi:hypothetical protein
MKIFVFGLLVFGLSAGAPSPISFKECSSKDNENDWGYTPSGKGRDDDGQPWTEEMRCADHPHLRSGKVAGFPWCYVDAGGWKECTPASFKGRAAGQAQLFDRIAARHLRIWSRIFGTKAVILPTPEAKTAGSAFLKDSWKVGKVCTKENYFTSECPKGLCRHDAEHDGAAIRAILGGSVPGFLTELVPIVVRVKGTDADRKPQVVTWVMRDGIAVGNDDGDYVRVPLSGVASRCLADKLKLELPTAYISEQTFQASSFKLLPTGLHRSDVKNPKEYLAKNGGQDCSGWLGYFWKLVQSQLGSLGWNGAKGGGLTSGTGKEVIATTGCASSESAKLFGFYQLGVKQTGVKKEDAAAVHSGSNIGAHRNYYSDYSQATRLVWPTALALANPLEQDNWTEVSLRDALAGPLSKILNAGIGSYIPQNGAPISDVTKCFTTPDSKEGFKFAAKWKQEFKC